jgi:hypothetical protein
MQGEFFASSSTMKSLVRESFQNSLDASPANTEGPVKIRIYFSGEENALPPALTLPFLSGAWEHYQARYNGLRNCPANNEHCRYLVIEDFNTTGLNGNISEYTTPVKTNSFYSFFRSEGQSNKCETDRGRWGIGKFVLPKASRIKTLFGLTVRSEDNKKYLVGQTILKSHTVDNMAYTPDGWFGCLKEIDDDYLHMPADYTHDSQLVDKFSETFKLKRQSEPGLSIVIPYIDNEITYEEIGLAVIEEYFWPILKGDLCVTLEGPDQPYEIETGSLFDLIEVFARDGVHEQKAITELARWAIELDEGEYMRLKDPGKTGVPELSEDYFEIDLLNKLRKTVEAEDKIAIRVPLSIYDIEGSEEKHSFFNLFIQRSPDSQSGGMPVFIREGITIPNVKCIKARGYISLVIVEDSAIADFLGNAENPSHKEWHENSENFKGKYKYGSQTLRFVRNSVAKILEIIDQSSEKEDKNLLVDTFSIPSPSEGLMRPDKPEDTPGETDEPDIPPLEPKPKYYRVSKIDGGFTIVHGKRPISSPVELSCKIFYDRRGGRAKYSPLDFCLDKKPIEIESEGTESFQGKDNQLTATIINEDFCITVKGFDQKRDLLIKPVVNEMEVADAEA